MLKYEGLAKIGDKIRGFDHQPIEGRRDRYIEGIVVKLAQVQMALCYEIYVMVDTCFEGDYSRVGKTALIPFETSGDYDGRVTRRSLEDEDVTEVTITQIGGEVINFPERNPGGFL